jgi:subtilisin family serine protease
MNPKIDPQLAMLAETAQSGESFESLAESGFFGIESIAGDKRPGRRGAATASPEVQVLVQATASAEALAKAGLTVRSEVGDVFTGTIAIDRLPALVETEGVERVESAREMIGELDLAIVESRANLVHQGPPGRRGNGVLIGVVDSGIDYTHPSFRRADGTSRIQFIWDQTLARQGSEQFPPGFNYGVQYTNAQINAALATANPFNSVRHRDGGGHGSHVAGIAAGDGSAAGQGQPPFTFIGVAPEADLIIVKVCGGGAEGLGTSATALDAVNYCYQRAQQLGRPIAVNMSLGDNLGPHDGTSLLERGLDNLLGPAGRAFVKSAGNVGNARHHAAGNLATGATIDVGVLQPEGNTTPDQLDFWYRGGDTFRAAVVDSAGNATGFVNVGNTQTFTLPGGNSVRIDHRNNDPFNGDRRIFITLQVGSASQIRPGQWSVRLRSVSSPLGGRFDGWIQRHNAFNQRPTFTAPFESNDRTISTPGTAREVITAANYITRGAGVGSLAASSSRGPTRDGRAAPTLSAPGQSIFSARAEPGSGDPYVGSGGTSMSAPHITGAIALMLQKNPNRTQAQIRDCLTNTARGDAFTGPVPNTAWGAGKLDVQAAVNCTPIVLRPSVIVPACRSVATPCVSVPLSNCPSLVSPCASRVITKCPSAIATTCVSHAVCPSKPVVTCGGSPSALVICGGPSIVDGCPSAPGGCGPTTVINPGHTVVVQPARSGDSGGEYELHASDWADQLPAQGYFEYDEGWFDEEA